MAHRCLRVITGECVKHCDAPHPLRLLPPRRDWPYRRRTADQRDELAAPHSITSSARASSIGGTVEAERLGGLEVDDQFELGRLLHRQVPRLGALENLVNVASRTSIQVSHTRPVGDESTGRHKFSKPMKRWQLLPRREVRNALSMINGERVFDSNQRFRVLPSRRFEYAIEVVWPSHLQGLNLYPQYSACGLRLFEDNRGIRIGRIPKHRHASRAGAAAP